MLCVCVCVYLVSVSAAVCVRSRDAVKHICVIIAAKFRIASLNMHSQKHRSPQTHHHHLRNIEAVAFCLRALMAQVSDGAQPTHLYYTQHTHTLEPKANKQETSNLDVRTQPTRDTRERDSVYIFGRSCARNFMALP